MSKRIFENEKFSIVKYYVGKNQGFKYQITFGKHYIAVTRQEVQQILKQIEMYEYSLMNGREVFFGD